jgi:predicted nucleotidyltransferase
MSRHRVDRLQSYFLERPELGVVSVYLFGSRSLGRYWDRALGLAVLADPELHPGPERRAELLERIAPELSRVAAEASLDLVMLNDAPPRPGRRIVREGRRIVSNDPHLDRTFLRDVQIRAVDLEAFTRRPVRRARVEAVAR